MIFTQFDDMVEGRKKEKLNKSKKKSKKEKYEKELRDEFKSDKQHNLFEKNEKRKKKKKTDDDRDIELALAISIILANLSCEDEFIKTLLGVD